MSGPVRVLELAPVRIAGFLVLLGAVFAIAYLIGSALG